MASACVRHQIAHMASFGLNWVIADGRPTHVSRFAGLRPGLRPRVACPQCGRRLTLKLGRVLRHHAAHAPRDRCTAMRPETALHLDAKYHLAACLESAGASKRLLVIGRRCAGDGTETCTEEQQRDWLSGWDEVLVEVRVETQRFRPDIVLRRQGNDVAAIEILVSHAVDDAKAEALRVTGIPWIEVRATAPLLGGDSAWTVDRPLPVVREGDGGGSAAWRCTVHEREHGARMAAAADAQAAEAEASRHRSVLRGARVVDVYHANGERERMIYRVEEERTDGSVRGLVLRRGTRTIAEAAADDAPGSRRQAWHRLREHYVADVADQSGASGRSDSPMRWASGDAAANLVHEAMSDLVPGDPTPLATRYPRRWFFDQARERWFLPSEMRDVRWDRPEYDVFAAHPAWAAGRKAVRERAAPASAWNTFVFARRPSVFAFGREVTPMQAPTSPAIVILRTDVAPPVHPRTLVLLTRAVPDETVRLLAALLDKDTLEHVWLSHPMDWTAARADLAWAPAGSDARGRGVVVVDGVGVYRAEQFARAFARGDRRVTPAAIRAATAERVAALMPR